MSLQVYGVSQPESVQNHQAKTKSDAAAVCSDCTTCLTLQKLRVWNTLRESKRTHHSIKDRFQKQKGFNCWLRRDCNGFGLCAVTTSTSKFHFVRHGFLSVPTVLTEDIPLDTYITNLFECCYQHKWHVILLLLPLFLTNFISQDRILKLKWKLQAHVLALLTLAPEAQRLQSMGWYATKRLS